MVNKLYNGDCLEIMPKVIADKSIDLILCDLPYGTTALKWDKVINFDRLWQEYERVIKDDGIICLFSIQPFTTQLIHSNLKLWRYNWVWQKESPTGFLNTNYKPLNLTEDICIFSKSTVGSLSKNPIRYFPQGVKEVNIEKHNNPNSTWRKNKGYPSKTNKLNSNAQYTQKYTNYPTNILKFARDNKNGVSHETKKPVALLEYLIRTYTQEGETVLDNCMGSGSTGIACVNTNRNFIGIELSEEYFRKSKERIELRTSSPLNINTKNIEKNNRKLF